MTIILTPLHYCKPYLYLTLGRLIVQTCPYFTHFVYDNVLALCTAFYTVQEHIDIKGFYLLTFTKISLAWLVGRLTFPFSTKILTTSRARSGWIFSAAMWRVANNTVTSRPHCLFVQWRSKMGKNRGGSFKLLHNKTRWKLTNYHKT